MEFVCLFVLVCVAFEPYFGGWVGGLGGALYPEAPCSLETAVQSNCCVWVPHSA